MRLCIPVCLIWIVLSTWGAAQSVPVPLLQWRSLPPIPDQLGLAGPVVGVYDDMLLVGCGANFAQPVWEQAKQWHGALYVLDLRSPKSTWQQAGMMTSPVAYSACASTPYGVALIGGNDESQVFKQVWLLKPLRRANGRVEIMMQTLPALPQPLVYGQAVWARDRLVVLSGQTGSELSTAIAGGWELTIAGLDELKSNQWKPIVDCPGGVRAFAMLTMVPADQAINQLLLLGGRRQATSGLEFLSDVWQYDVATKDWQRLASLPVPVSAGGAGPIGNRMVAVLSGDDGSLFTQTDKLKDDHPGFAKRTWLFDVAANRWHAGAPSPVNQVTTPPVAFGQQLILASGEVRPRVRTNQVWEVRIDK